MEKAIVVSSLDHKIEVVAHVEESGLELIVRPFESDGFDWPTFRSTSDAIATLRDLGYQYAEDMVRLAVRALEGSSYAA